MKTNLSITISIPEDIEAFFQELEDNNEMFHPEDDAHGIEWGEVVPTNEEKDKLNELMQQCFNVHDDPCGIAWDIFEKTEFYQMLINS